jgi:hypothetical protein
MKTLQVTQEVFLSMLPELIQSGVNFEAIQHGAGILITFTGGY